MKLFSKIKKSWRTKAVAIVILIAVVNIGLGPSDSSDTEPVTLANVVGFLLGCILVFGPMLWVNLKNIKIGRQKQSYIEPHPLLLAPILLIFWVINIILAIQLEHKLNLNEIGKEYYFGFSFILAWGLPITAYHVFIKTKYKKIIEYGSANWYKRRQG